jgi:hypothetical protein
MELGQQCPGSFFARTSAPIKFFGIQVYFRTFAVDFNQPSESVDQPNDSISNESYLDGLRHADAGQLEKIYTEIRPNIIRAISALGGSSAAGNVFFQTAVVEAAHQVRAGEWPADVPFFYQIKALAVAHFNDWLTERGQELPPSPEPDPAEAGFHTVVPPVEQLRATRSAITVWRKPDPTVPPPDDQDGKKVWQQLRTIESRISEGSTASKGSRRLTRILASAGLVVVAVFIYYLYTQYASLEAPGKIYKSNFNPPKSIVEDMKNHRGAEMGNDSVGARPNQCDQVLEDADAYYKQKKYGEALAALEIICDQGETVCESDAWYYKGIIELDLGQPEESIASFAKVSDIERFGEDLYWYQALAVVKVAALDPTYRDYANGAVQRYIEVSQNPERREQAQKMLDQLSK